MTREGSSGRRQRVRFDGLDYEVFPDGRCRAVVRLEWAGELFTGEAEGTEPLAGSLRTAASATLRAASEVARGSLDMTLVGIKAIRAFDVDLVVSSVTARAGESRYRLLGAKAAEDEELVEAACRSVLDAINRVLELYVVDPDEPDPDARPESG